MPRTTVLVSLSLVIAGCGAATNAQGTAMPITSIQKEVPPPGGDAPLREVIRTQDAWDALYRRLRGGASPPPPPPSIDFSREMVLVISLGMRTSGGFGVAVTASQQTPTDIVVTVEETVPGPTCMVTMAITYPFTAVTLPTSDTPVRFVETKKVDSCS